MTRVGRCWSHACWPAGLYQKRALFREMISALGTISCMYGYRRRATRINHDWNIADGASHAVTLLVPLSLFTVMKEAATRRRVRLATFLRDVIGGCRSQCADHKLHHADSCTTLYQRPHQSLVRVAIRLDSARWLEFSQLCRFHGVSRCRMFALLLERELQWGEMREDQNVGTRTNMKRRQSILGASILAFREEATVKIMNPRLKREISFISREWGRLRRR